MSTRSSAAHKPGVPTIERRTVSIRAAFVLSGTRVKVPAGTKSVNAKETRSGKQD